MNEAGEVSACYSPDISSDHDEEWIPTPQIRTNLSSLNGFISISEHDVSPVRGQLQLPVSKVSSSTSRYYKRKLQEICRAVLDCIAPGQSQALFELMTSEKVQDIGILKPIEGSLVQRLIILYEESNSWITKQAILSIFVQDYSKSQLKEMVPGLTKWRIDEARKHAALAGPQRRKEIPEVHCTCFNPVKVDHFVDFIASHSPPKAEASRPHGGMVLPPPPPPHSPRQILKLGSPKCNF